MMNNRPVTIREAYVQASSFLEKHRVEDGKSCAEILLQHVLGWTRSELLLNWQDPFPEEKEQDWQVLLARKAAGKPVQYLTGEQEFYGLPFRVTPAVLIPRPETELLVMELLARGQRIWPEPDSSPLLADVGTGSGAIPVTIAVKRPNWQVMSVDISAAALEVARSNAVRNGVESRVKLVEGDLLEPWIKEQAAIDILVSNPPYIPSAEIPVLQREVKDHEPHTALDGGEDGLSFYRRLVESMQRLPRLPRLVGFETGMGQARLVARLLEAAGWSRVDIVKDLSNIERHVLAER